MDSKSICVSVIGYSNRGKTYILSKISGIKKMEEVAKFSIQTKGLSIKYPKYCDYYLLDTIGFNAPILVEDLQKDIRKDDDY